MEEDIKVLEEFILIDRNMRNNKVESDYDEFCERRCIAIENLIKRYKELKEQFKKAIEYRQALEKDLFENSSNYVISKDKIRKYKNILENKLNEYKINLNNKKYICTTNLSKEEEQLIDNIIVQISTLEELLEE